MDLQMDIQYLKGVGPARAKYYERLGVRTLYDLIYHFPRSYIDLSAPVPAAGCPAGEPCAVRARVMKKLPAARIRKGLTLFKLTAEDESGQLEVTLFNAQYAFDALEVGETYFFYGRVQPGPRPQMAAPLIFSPQQASAYMPVYPLTAGLTNKAVAQNVRQALLAVRDSLADPLPAGVREQYQLCELRYALENIHFPAGRHAAALARDRLIFEELFLLTLALRSIRARSRVQTAIRLSPGLTPESFYRSLPFTPTGAQRRAVDEILRDLAGQVPMNRLLQGDVGSGKTLVAAAACLLMAQSGYQCAFMAPTEILAAQHRETLEGFLGPLGVRVALLTGGMPAAQRREALAALEAGETAVAVGTHALLGGGVCYRRLGLVVTDEQHRFGVAQRVALQQKGENPHVLVMSATPIPRTLALIIYGDLELSVLDELPRGRVPVSTYCISPQKLPRAYGFIRGQLDAGRQAYIVCPLVGEGEAEAGETPGLVAAQKVARELKEGAFAGYRVEILHGKMKGARKEAVMAAFKAGDIQLLICTTVVEVGVDVPNATVMMCLNAERFGLSQLHQLRGRVGRGRHPSHCILVSDARGEAARERLRALCETSDGFALAQTDLRLRGPGDFFGGRQHGLPRLRIADMAQDVDVLARAQEAAIALLAQDPTLSQPGHGALHSLCARIIESVGQRPN